jgi:hypothetical protein
LEDFSHLPAPRQAEWFDREFKTSNRTQIDVAALRLHLLGSVLHRDDRILSNPLLRELARLIAQSAIDLSSAGRRVDVITTNVDCALEQNIAWAIEEQTALRTPTASARPEGSSMPVRLAEIETIVGFCPSARWKLRLARSGHHLRIRIWKLHGCLREVKIRLSDDAEMTRAVLSLADNSGARLCGHVPTDHLAADLTGGWQQTLPSDDRSYMHSGVFSQSEYFRNLLMLARGELEASRNARFPAAERQLLAEFQDVLVSRPLIFVGYSIPEVDVDVIYALQRYAQREADIGRWQLMAQRELSASTRERLRQMGVRPWSFEVSNVGFAAIPGKLGAARRHEWRSTLDNPLDLPPERDWRRALQRVSAQAWLEPQLRAITALGQRGGQGGNPVPAPMGQRLVVAGLGSIWHGIALTQSADFPVQRRVSARLIGVDTQVPGGSGLVPVMVAAAAAGPPAVGSMVFFSNVPGTWGSWNEIEDMCLSAGVAVRSWTPESATRQDGTASIGRTSHVIFFDPSNEEAPSHLPRQRFIMDVQTLANEALAPQVTDWSKLTVPPARLADGFQDLGQEDFLFTDKESDPRIISGWNGPTVYETGSSGDELATRLGPIGARPTIWTAGVGSFIRTMVALAGRVPSEEAYAGGRHEVLRHIEADPHLAAFTRCDGGLRERYVAKLVSFGRKGIWDFDGVEGFNYYDELAYGVWLRDHWPELAKPTWSLLRTGTRAVLSDPHPLVGGGVLTTIHEGGLMAFWQWPGGQTEQTSVTVETALDDKDSEAITVRCAISPRSSADAGRRELAPVIIQIQGGQLKLVVGDKQECLGRSDPIRRNTLAAGDTVRGAMAYGLWRAAYQTGHRADIDRIFLASAALASLKCYAGSFVDFLRIIERLRGTPTWTAMWDL